MTNLRRSFFWAALYLALILVLGQADYIGRPIINFASYFYVVAMIGVPVTLFFPGVTRVSTRVPMSALRLSPLEAGSPTLARGSWLCSPPADSSTRAGKC